MSFSYEDEEEEEEEVMEERREGILNRVEDFDEDVEAGEAEVGVDEGTMGDPLKPYDD